MKTNEVTLRVKKFLENGIDLYLPKNGFMDKIKNATAKFWLEQNCYKLKNIINAFADEDDDICIDTLMKFYDSALFEDNELRIDVKTILPDNMDYLKDFLPDKIVIFSKDEIYGIFK